MSYLCTKILGTLADSGHPVGSGGRVLDLGCGNGNLMQLVGGLGYDAFGCEMPFKKGQYAAAVTQSEHLRQIHLLFRMFPILGWVIGERQSRALLTVRSPEQV